MPTRRSSSTTGKKATFRGGFSISCALRDMQTTTQQVGADSVAGTTGKQNKHSTCKPPKPLLALVGSTSAHIYQGVDSNVL